MIVACMRADSTKWLGYSIASFIHVVDKLVLAIGPELMDDEPVIKLFTDLYPDKIFLFREPGIEELAGGENEAHTRVVRIAFQLAQEQRWNPNWLFVPDDDNIFYHGIYSAPKRLRMIEGQKTKSGAPEYGVVRTREYQIYPDRTYSSHTWAHFIRWVQGIKYENNSLCMPPGFSGQITIDSIDFIRVSDIDSGEKLERFDNPLPSAMMKGYEHGTSQEALEYIEQYVKENEKRRIER